MATSSSVAKSVAVLACGQRKADTDFSTLVAAISKNLALLVKILADTAARGGDQSTILTPYLMRSVMEVSLTAVLGRLDPFRLLTIGKVQSSSEYELGRRANSAVQWFGDVHTKDLTDVRWDPDKKPEAYSRALLDGCWNELAWQRAFERAINFVGTEAGWSAELRALEPKDFIRAMRGRLVANYSALSKGVHNEFVIDRSIMLDSLTIAELVASSFKVVAFLCFVSHFVDHVAMPLRSVTALRHLKIIEEAAFV